MDLKKFFDSVNYDVLMHRAVRKVRDKRVLKLIGKYLRAGVIVRGCLEQTRKDLLQGGPLSPLLTNIVFDDMDKKLELRGHCFVCYADDFLILVKSQPAAERVMGRIERFIERKIKVTENKSWVKKAESVQ